MTDNLARVRAYEADKERINSLKRGDDTQADVIRRLLDGAKTDTPERDVPDGLLAVSEATEDELAKIQERLEQLPELTADELEERLR